MYRTPATVEIFDKHFEYNHNECKTEPLWRSFAMSTMTIKSMPAELYEKLKIAAAAHHRSINSEAIYCIETVLKNALPSVDERLRQIRQLRKATEGHPITEEEINELKTWGRE